MKHEGITICVGATALKFLKITLPQNIKFFDNYIVATDFKDIETQEYCRKWAVTLFITDLFYADNAIFNKGRVYNAIFNILTHKSEISILDGDMFISDKLGRFIKETEFNIDMMYGSRRLIIPNIKDFKELLNGNKELENSLWCPNGCAWGYHQQFNYQASIFNGYPPFYPHSYEKFAACGDWQFRNIFFGELSKDETECLGNLRMIDEKIWHLGEPNMENGGEKFFIDN